MSRFFSRRHAQLKAYVPGEQPKQRNLIKLNTNESPWPPAPGIGNRVRETAERLNLYCDPEAAGLKEKLAGSLEISPEQLIVTNGSDEALDFAFLAFCDEEHPAVFPDITYGFYPVFARLYHIPFREIPLREDWRVNPADYDAAGGTIFLANPNAPTGLALSLRDIRGILDRNPDSVVVIDEAYVDFGGESALPLIREYDHLLVVRTFSKSRGLAGLRLGFAMGQKDLIQDLKTLQYSTNPYNVDRLAQAAGLACLEEDAVNREHVRQIREIRAWTAEQLKDMGFEATDSQANFLFVRHPAFPGSALRDRLREKGILIRWFSQERIRDWNRISIGRKEDMEALTQAVGELLKEA